MIIQAFLLTQESVIFTAMLPDCLFITTNGQNCVRLRKHPLRAPICLTGQWQETSHGYGKTVIFRFSFCLDDVHT